jgi:5-hydroxyisourate hydrolase-like protein (transthyretin family)
LKPGQYRLGIAVQDLSGDRIGSSFYDVLVPAYEKDALSVSSMVLADKMISRPQIGGIPGEHPWVGTTSLRPFVASSEGMPISVRRGQNISLWMQVYGLIVDEKSNKPSANVEFELETVGSPTAALHISESTDTLGSHGGQITLKQTLPASNFKSGSYTLRIRVRDNASGQALNRSTNFVVE